MEVVMDINKLVAIAMIVSGSAAAQTIPPAPLPPAACPDGLQQQAQQLANSFYQQSDKARMTALLDLLKGDNWACTIPYLQALMIWEGKLRRLPVP
jgi:hypothetical protein